MTFPSFSSGEVLRATDMNAVGLWLVKSQVVGNGVSSVTVTGAFSADYDNYLVTWTGGVGSTGLLTKVSLGSSTTGYNNVLVYGNSYATPSATGGSTNNGAAWEFMGWMDSDFGHISFDLYGPFLSRFTGCSMRYMGATNAGVGAGVHKVAASYTSFTITPTTGTMTGGTIRIYGYRN